LWRQFYTCIQNFDCSTPPIRVPWDSWEQSPLMRLTGTVTTANGTQCFIQSLRVQPFYSNKHLLYMYFDFETSFGQKRPKQVEHRKRNTCSCVRPGTLRTSPRHQLPFPPVAILSNRAFVSPVTVRDVLLVMKFEKTYNVLLPSFPESWRERAISYSLVSHGTRPRIPADIAIPS
jgi:hypothetical protein